VFVTAHQQYAVPAFDAEAVDYLVKPLSEPRFRATMQRLFERMRVRRAGDRIGVQTAEGTLLLGAGEISRIEAEGDHALIHAGRERHRVRQTLGALESRLGSEFARVHRSAIVRLDQVREVRTDGAGETILVLRDGAVLRVSRRRAAAVKARLRPESSS
jgi:two-component system, LytTR family, response regulator